MKRKLLIIALFSSAMLAAGCQSQPTFVVQDLPARPKPPAPTSLDKPLPEPGFFQTRLQILFDSLQPEQTK